MRHFIFYTAEGFTFSPNYNDIENCQILAFEYAGDIKRAKDLFNQHHAAYLAEHGFSIEQVVCKEII